MYNLPLSNEKEILVSKTERIFPASNTSVLISQKSISDVVGTIFNLQENRIEVILTL